MTDNYSRFRDFIEIDSGVFELVRRAAPALLLEVDFIVSRFYQRIRKHPEAMARFPGGESQLARQEDALRQWLKGLLESTDTGPNLERQYQVGRVHLAASINEELMVAAINWIRSDFHELCFRVTLPIGIEPRILAENISRLIDYNLALMQTSYWRSLQERAMALDRLAMIGQFTATVNHELRNPLGVIGTSNFLLRQRINALGADDQALKHINKIDRSLDRANSIITGLLRLLKVEQPERAQVNLRELLREFSTELEVPENVEIEFEVEDGQAYGFCDPVQLSQVLHNLVRNAVEAMVEGGRIKVSAGFDAVAAVLKVQDDGPGIPLNLRSKIYDPLFSTKSFGTGLGLTVAKSIVSSHGGELKFTEGLNESGAGFLVRLPHDMGMAPS